MLQSALTILFGLYDLYFLFKLAVANKIENDKHVIVSISTKWLMKARNHQYLPWFQIHIATLLFGLSGVIGKYLQVPALYLVAGRTVFACLVLIVFIRIMQEPLQRTNIRCLGGLSILGALLAFHWFSFFYAIEISTVAIALISFSSFPVFVALLEPTFFKERYDVSAFVSAILVVIGMVTLVSGENTDTELLRGATWGIMSGLSFAILTLGNRHYVKTYSASELAFYQNCFAFCFLVPFLSLNEIGLLTEYQWLGLVLLGVIFTAVAHTLLVRSMKKLKAQVVSVIVSLEPVYAIVFAAMLLSEMVVLKTIMGGLMILFAALIASKKR